MAYYYYKEKEQNKLELHYWLKNKSHTMDAFVQNRCEDEFLDLLAEIAKTFRIEIIVETEPLAKGGLRRFYNVISRQESSKAVITTAVVTAIVTTILTTPLTVSLTKLTEAVIEKVFSDEKTEQLLKEKHSLEIIKFKQEIEINNLRLNESKINRRVVNFYNHLQNYPDIEKVSFVLSDEKLNYLFDEQIVDKVDFQDYQHISKSLYIRNILSDNYFKESMQEIENASIEIISPDFSINSDLWKGIYDGKRITFKILSSEFNNQVQSGNIQFRKGSKINCFLTIIKTRPRTVVYEVLNINSYIE